MKKMIVLLLVLALGLSLCACGAKDERLDMLDSTQYRMYKTMSRKMGINFLEQDIDPIHTYDDIISVYMNNCQYLEENCVIELGNGTTLQFPMTYGDLCNAGWTLEDEEISDPFPAEEYIWFSFINSDGKTIEAEIGNGSETPVEVRDAIVTQFECGDSGTETFSVKGIAKGATVKEILAVFGLPYGCTYDGGYKSLDFYYVNESNTHHLSFFMDPETGLLDSIWFS